MPNVGSKTTLARSVYESPRGRVSYGAFSGPAQYTEQVMRRKPSCNRSMAGPDPYCLSISHRSNAWHSRSPGRFAIDDGKPRTPHVLGRATSAAFDPCASPAVLTPPHCSECIPDVCTFCTQIHQIHMWSPVVDSEPTDFVCLLLAAYFLDRSCD